MGRVQNAFYFLGTFLQIALSLTVATVAQKIGLAAGFAIIGSIYVLAFVSAAWPNSVALPLFRIWRTEPEAPQVFASVSQVDFFPTFAACYPFRFLDELGASNDI